MSSAIANETPPLSVLLKSVSTNSHESLDKRIMALAPFSNRARYSLFLRTQARLHQAVSRCFQDTQLNAWLPGLNQRDRVASVLQDCEDLEVSKGAQVEDALAAAQVLIDNPYTTLGWLYTVEGSNLGAAFLLKIARKELDLSETFGARHMAGHDDGRGVYWRTFREQLDAIALTDEQRTQAQEGALAAFIFVRNNVESVMANVESVMAEAVIAETAGAEALSH